MANSHSKSFFGQNSALIVESPQKSLPFIFLKCIRKKEDGNWEKIKEGKTVKITIEEIICILEVLNRKSANWRGYHVFKDYQTEIYVAWEDKSRQVCVFRISDYEKKLRFPNNRFLTLLLEHILSEKIEFATSDTYINEEVDRNKTSDENGGYRVFSEQIFARDGLQVIETTGYDLSSDKIEISAKIKAKSPKAILISINNNKEFWIPKNTIHSKYDLEDREKIQKFLVDRWIIKKNKIKLN